MTILGFRGVHPLAFLFFPAAALILFGGFWLLWRFQQKIPVKLRAAYVWFYGFLALGAACLYPVARLHQKYLVLYYMTVLAAFAVLNLALCTAALLRAPGQTCPHAASRRRFLTGGLMAAAGSLISIAGVDAATGDGAKVTERRIGLRRSPGAPSGRELRISLVSDFHAGFFLPGAHLSEAASRIAAFRPDVILFGGDLVEYELAALDEVKLFFHTIRPIAPVYAVLGNHDCYIDPDGVAAFHRLGGVRVLRGESVLLAGPWGRFTLCGTRDLSEQGVNFGCLDGLDPASTILLAHNPQTALLLPPELSPWLTLSGHTHGGQIRLPLAGALVNQADRRIKAGLGEIEGRRIVVTAGLGYSGLPVRLLCPPDVTNIVVS